LSGIIWEIIVRSDSLKGFDIKNLIGDNGTNDMMRFELCMEKIKNL
jgi:hypothetical protein